MAGGDYGAWVCWFVFTFHSFIHSFTHSFIYASTIRLAELDKEKKSYY